jgi:hypothetical protein
MCCCARVCTSLQMGHGARVKGMLTLPIPAHAPLLRVSPTAARSPYHPPLVHGWGGHVLGPPLPRLCVPLLSMHQGWAVRGACGGGGHPKKGGMCGKGNGRHLTPPWPPRFVHSWGSGWRCKRGARITLCLCASPAPCPLTVHAPPTRIPLICMQATVRVEGGKSKEGGKGGETCSNGDMCSPHPSFMGLPVCKEGARTKRVPHGNGAPLPPHPICKGGGARKRVQEGGITSPTWWPIPTPSLQWGRVGMPRKPPDPLI